MEEEEKYFRSCPLLVVYQPFWDRKKQPREKGAFDLLLLIWLNTTCGYTWEVSVRLLYSLAKQTTGGDIKKFCAETVSRSPSSSTSHKKLISLLLLPKGLSLSPSFFPPKCPKYDVNTPVL